MNDTLAIENVKSVDPPLKLETTFRPRLLEVDTLVRASAARAEFRCDGSGARVAVLDTGLNTTHVDFAGRVVTQRNYTNDNATDANDATDGHGHGTNVTGIICANDIHTSIAPGAEIVAITVLRNNGRELQVDPRRPAVDHRQPERLRYLSRLYVVGRRWQLSVRRDVRLRRNWRSTIGVERLRGCLLHCSG